MSTWICVEHKEKIVYCEVSLWQNEPDRLEYVKYRIKHLISQQGYASMPLCKEIEQYLERGYIYDALRCCSSMLNMSIWLDLKPMPQDVIKEFKNPLLEGNQNV